MFMIFNSSCLLCPQRGDDGRFRMTHKSIKDFLFDQTRAKELFASFDAEQTVMAQRCLEILITELRQDPCKYGTMVFVFV